MEVEHKEDRPFVRRDHSVKVPKLYKVAAKVLSTVEKHEDGFKGAIFNAHHPNKKALTALVSTTINNLDDLNYIISKSKLYEQEEGLEKNDALAKILIAELLWGKKRLGGDAKPILTVLKYREKFEAVYNKLLRKPSRKGEAGAEQKRQETVEKPRYVRVNTLKMSLNDALSYLEQEGWIKKDIQQVNDFTEYDFAVDDFVDNLLVFAPKTSFHSHPLYLDGTFILQDKASCLAAIALKPRLGRSVIDACAAPGMKTTLLANMLGESADIIAVEKNEKRCNTLRSMLEQYNCNFVKVLNQDFTEINPTEHEDVEYILVDPSCSGSGMYGRFQVPTSSESNSDRLYHLSYYQQKTLCHAMKFPNVKRIVYSTCSLNSEENEDVINGSLEFADNHTRFRLKKALPNWKHRCTNTKYDWAEMCVKCDYETDKTDGFFIAVIERLHNKNRKKKSRQETPIDDVEVE